MLKIVKVRVYPDVPQQQSLAQAFGSCRWLRNYCLNLMNQTYKETGKGLSGYEVKKLIPQLKKEHNWQLFCQGKWHEQRVPRFATPGKEPSLHSLPHSHQRASKFSLQPCFCILNLIVNHL